MNIDKFKDFKFSGKDIIRIMYKGHILWERVKKVTFRKKMLYKNKDNFNNDKWIVVDVSLGLTCRPSLFFWYATALWIDTWYNKIYVGTLPYYNASVGTPSYNDLTVPRDRLDFSNIFPSDYDIYNNMLYAKLVPANAIDGFIVAPGYLITYREYGDVQSSGSRFKITNTARLSSISYSTSSSLYGYQDVINSVCSESRFDGFYILYTKKPYGLKLMKVYNNAESYNVTISNVGGSALYNNEIFMYKDKLYILSFRGRLDDYANNSAFIVRVSKNNGAIEAKYNFAVNNANSRGEFYITGYAVIGNILYVRFNNENDISHIVRFNLDSFSYMNATPIMGFNNTQQRYQYDSQTNNMRAIDDSLYTLFVDTNNKRYLARLSSEDYTMLDKVELTERYSSNTIDKCSINLITENNNLEGYFPDSYKDRRPASIGIFANPRMTSNSDYGIVIEEIYVDRK